MDMLQTVHLLQFVGKFSITMSVYFAFEFICHMPLLWTGDILPWLWKSMQIRCQQCFRRWRAYSRVWVLQWYLLVPISQWNQAHQPSLRSAGTCHWHFTHGSFDISTCWIMHFHPWHLQSTGFCFAILWLWQVYGLIRSTISTYL